MIKMAMGNIRTKVVHFDHPVEEEAIKRALTFVVPNFWFMKSYRNRVWDGTYSFYNRYSRTFPTGLLNVFPSKIKDRLKITDCRKKPEGLELGEPTLRGIVLRDYQIEAINEAIRKERCIIQSPTNAGKALPVDAKVYTPHGPVRMGDVRVGDIVCTPSGGVATVVGVFPQGMVPVYRITFRNGDSVESTADHLWKIGSRVNGVRPKVVRLADIMGNYLSPSGRPVYQIYPSECVAFRFRPVDIPPYLMGVLLGNGKLSGSIVISNADEELLGRVKELLLADYRLRYDRGCDYLLTRSHASVAHDSRGHLCENYYVEALKRYGLWGKRAEEKFVPDDYKYNDAPHRIALLQGLMDTDGYAQGGKRGIEFCSCSKRLAMDVKELVESLGGVARFRSKIPSYLYGGEKHLGRRAFTVTISGDLAHNLFSISRKRNKVLVGNKHQSRVITKIEPVGEKECQCLYVDSPEHMYVTDHCVPTHNTEMGAGIMKVLRHLRILWLIHRGDLMYQTKERLEHRLGEPVGVIHRDKLDIRRVNVAMVQTLYKRLRSKGKQKQTKVWLKDFLMNHVDVMILDECLDGQTQVATPKGEVALQTLRAGDEVLTPDGKVARVRRIWKTRKPAFLFRVKGQHRYLIASKDHVVKTPDGLKEIGQAKRLTLGITGVKRKREKLFQRTVELRQPIPLGVRDLYDIEIDSHEHLFVANGFIVSNCHHTSSTSWRTIAKSCNAFYRYGLSATPLMREEIQNLWLIGMTGEEIKTVTNRDLIRRGISARPRIVRIKNWVNTAGREYRGAYKVGVELNEKRNQTIAGLMRLHKRRNEPILVLVNTIRHGNAIKAIAPPGTVFLSGLETSEYRVAALRNLKRGIIKTLIATPIFDEGIDAPIVRAMVLGGAGKSHMRLLQRIGRGMRRKPSGENVVTIYDFEDKGDKYLEGHSIYRLKLYQNEGFDVIPTTIQFERGNE